MKEFTIQLASVKVSNVKDEYLRCNHPKYIPIEEDGIVSFFVQTGSGLNLFSQNKEKFMKALITAEEEIVLSDMLDLNSEFSIAQLKTYMFAAGYLTIKKHTTGLNYTLALPNAEIMYFYDQKIMNFEDNAKAYSSIRFPRSFDEKLIDTFQQIQIRFGKLTYSPREKKRIREAEYQRMFTLMVFNYLNQNEKSGPIGRVDNNVCTPDYDVVFEFKVIDKYSRYIILIC